MKKVLIITSILAITVTGAFAQKKKVDTRQSSSGTPFHKGTSTLAIGLGAGVDYGYYNRVTRLPALIAYFDHGIVDNLGPGNLGIGGIIAYNAARFKHPNGDRATWSNVIVGVRGTWHLTLLADKNNKFDPYAGAMAGLRFQSYDDPYYNGIYNPHEDYNKVNPAAGLFIGAKYNFTPQFGAWSELGYDVAFFKLGVNFNF